MDLLDYTLWKQRLYDAIRNISDLAFQQRAWLGTGPEVSSFVETYCTLYDDSFFPEFLTYDQHVGVSQRSLQELETLRRLMDAYVEPDTDAAILADPQWHQIVRQAQLLLQLDASTDRRLS